MSLLLPQKAGEYDHARAFQWVKAAGKRPHYALTGRLILSESGWLLLEVPNALIRGAFQALDEPGTELPTKDTNDPNSQVRAHVSVVRPEEIATIPGGAEAISERGRHFRYRLGRIRKLKPSGWKEMSRCWVIEVKSPELEKLRKTYGLSAKPNEDKFDFHITFAVRRKGVLYANDKSKAASVLGIPDRSNLGDLSKLQAGQLLDFVIQQHKAQRAGCFAAGSPVDMADGSQRAIEDLLPGDAVVLNGTIAKVERLWDNGIGEDWFEVLAGNTCFLATPQHPFFVRGVGPVPLHYLEGYEAHVDQTGKIRLATEDLQDLQAALSDTQCKNRNVQSILSSQVGAQTQRSSTLTAGNRDRAGTTEGESNEALGRLAKSKLSSLGRQDMAVSAILARGTIAGRDCSGIGLHAGGCYCGVPTLEDSIANGKIGKNAGQDDRREQLGLERRHLQRAAVGLQRQWLSTNEDAAKPDRGERREVRVVQEDGHGVPDRSASSDSVSFLPAQSRCNTALQEVSWTGGRAVSPIGWRVFRIKRLPRFPRRRFDLEIDHPSHQYKVGGCLVHNSHYDVRFGTPATGLYSWATRKELPEPGTRRALFQQPVHSHAYGDFQGTIGRGYGAGEVRQHRKGKILITSVEPTKVEFTTADEKHPQRFVLFKPQGGTFREKDWLLANTTPRQKPPYQKMHFTKIPREQVEGYLAQIQQGDSAEAKIDGASSLIELLKDGVEVTSYRVSKGTGHPIVHTERILHGRPKLQIPPELVGTVLKGEIYGERAGRNQTGNGNSSDAGNGREESSRGLAFSPAVRDFGTDQVIGPQDLGGLLNATLAKSLEDQRQKNLRLQVMLHGVQQFGKQPIDPEEVPYDKRREILQAVLLHLPADVFHLSESTAGDPEAARKLWADVVARKHPLSSEGIVIHPRTGKPMKAKTTEDQDVHIAGIFPGEKKYRGIGAGGFEYALEPGGPVTGRVGTGLSDEFRRELLAQPDEYIGRVARVRSQGPFASGALRAPAFIALHEDYSTGATA